MRGHEATGTGPPVRARVAVEGTTRGDASVTGTTVDPPGDAPLFDACNLHKAYGRVEALRGVSLSVLPGETLGVLGPNGAGKTTLIELAMGRLVPSSGTVRILGVDPRRHRRAVLRRVAVQPQQVSLFPALTVRETLQLWASMYPRPHGVDHIVAAVGLEDKVDARVPELSGGQLHRLSLGLGLIGRPDLLFLDEPSAGLDPVAQQRLWDVVRLQARSERSVVISTHDMEEARALCQRVAILESGRVMAVGSPDELIRRYAPDKRVSLSVAQPPSRRDLDALPAARAVEVAGNGPYHVEILTRDADVLLPALLAAPSVRLPKDIAVRSSTLRDVFVALTRVSIDANGERMALDATAYSS